MKKQSKTVKIIAINPGQFKLNYTNIVPGYSALSSGKEFSVLRDNKHVKDWLLNKIVKEK